MQNHYTPPKLADEGIQQHLNRLGVDYALFTKLADTGTPVAVMCKILKLPHMPKPWAWETMRKWLRQYASEQVAGAQA